MITGELMELLENELIKKSPYYGTLRRGENTLFSAPIVDNIL
jgi:hypothetical protein